MSIPPAPLRRCWAKHPATAAWAIAGMRRFSSLCAMAAAVARSDVNCPGPAGAANRGSWGSVGGKKTISRKCPRAASPGNGAAAALPCGRAVRRQGCRHGRGRGLPPADLFQLLAFGNRETQTRADMARNHLLADIEQVLPLALEKRRSDQVRIRLPLELAVDGGLHRQQRASGLGRLRLSDVFDDGQFD